MAVRVVCPSCSTALSVKDEFAGRPVKCPKCNSVIPPSELSASPSAPAPAPSESPPEATGQPDVPPDAEPAAPPAARPTARPVARPADLDDRPARRRGREDEDDRDRDDRRGPPRRRGGERASSGGSNVPLILGIVGFFMLTCCGGVGFGVYWVYNRAKETVEKTNWRVNAATYNGLRVGTTTRTQAEQTLGSGKLATADDVRLAFPKGADPDRLALWEEKAEQGRAVLWRNGEDFLLVAFHPNAEGPARVQMKEWRPENGAHAREGEPDDAAFLAKHPPGKTVDPPIGGPIGGPSVKDEEPPGVLPQVTAVDLAQAFKDNEAAANGKYKDQWLLVEGKVLDVRPAPDKKTNADTVAVDLVGVKFPNSKQDFPVRCSIRTEETGRGLNLTRGQTVKLKGKCTRGGLRQTYVTLQHCRIDSTGPDPAVPTTAATMLAEYIKDPEAANGKYRDKEVMITNARFESVAGDLAQFQTTPKKGGTIRIQVHFSFDQFKKLEQLKRGAMVKFKTQCGGLFPDPKGDDVIAGYRAYLVP